MQELAILGNPILDRMQASVVLHSLPDSWESVVVALNYSTTAVTIKNLPTLLGIEAERIAKKNTSKSFMSIASASEPPKNETLKNGKNFKNNDKMGKGKCFKCGKIGYYQANCRENKNNNKLNYGGSKDIICVVFESFLADVDFKD